MPGHPGPVRRAAVGPVSSVLGPEHPDTLAARASLGLLDGQAGDAAAARDQFAALLPISEHVLGPEHPDTLINRHNLANFEGYAGDAAAARTNSPRCSASASASFGADSPDTLVARFNLAYWTGRAGEASAAPGPVRRSTPRPRAHVRPEPSRHLDRTGGTRVLDRVRRGRCGRPGPVRRIAAVLRAGPWPRAFRDPGRLVSACPLDCTSGERGRHAGLGGHRPQAVGDDEGEGDVACEGEGDFEGLGDGEREGEGEGWTWDDT